MIENAVGHGRADGVVSIRVRDGELSVANGGQVIRPPAAWSRGSRSRLRG